MKITLSQEQSLLKDSVDRFLADRYDDAARRRREALPEGFDRELWQEIADLGWLGASIGAATGGYGGAREMAIVMEGAGHALMAEPLTGTYLALAILESLEARSMLDEALSAAAMPVGVLAEMADGVAVAGTNGNRRLTGRLRAVQGGEAADRLILATPEIVVALDLAEEGIARSAYRTMDGRRACDIDFNAVTLGEGKVLAEGEPAARAHRAASMRHSVCICAESVGVAAMLFERTLSYVKQREQFGQPIGRFQALQHRLADMFVALEEARSLSLAATRVAEAGAADDRSVSMSVTGTVDRALNVAREAIQLHGGVGMTEDLPLGAGLRRLKVLQLMPAGADDHRERLRQGVQ